MKLRAASVLVLLATVACARPQPEAPVRTPNVQFDSGHAISITRDGFVPRWLVAAEGRPITWTNTLSKPVRVTFDNVRDVRGRWIASGVIAAHAVWTWTPLRLASVAYHADGTKLTGRIQIISVQ